MKQRLDLYLQENGYFESREKAKRAIMAGNVIINDRAFTKAGMMISEKDIKTIRIKEKLKYVSRGGLKLEAAIKKFNIDFNNKIVLDIGSSTGGFTDCALQSGANYVYAVDVGTAQLDFKLRQNNKIKSIENTHINSLKLEELDKGLADIVVTDVSFISLTKIMEYIYKFSKEISEFVLLIKPQFELDKNYIGKNGIVKDETSRQLAIEKVLTCIKRYNFNIIGIIDSPIKGSKGNTEYLLYMKKGE